MELQVEEHLTIEVAADARSRHALADEQLEPYFEHADGLGDERRAFSRFVERRVVERKGEPIASPAHRQNAARTSLTGTSTADRRAGSCNRCRPSSRRRPFARRRPAPQLSLWRRTRLCLPRAWLRSLCARLRLWPSVGATGALPDRI